MLHQIVYCGNVPHLNEVLTFEITNEEFRLLCKSLDDKTVREVASERAHIYPQMLRRIERLVAIDQMLNNARDGKWELVKQLLRQQGEIVNEKPPYRKQYLAHYLASTGQLNMFKELSSICEFRLNLVAENKTINIVARENNFIEFAEHVEQLCPNINEAMGESEPVTPSTADSDLPSTTAHSLFSHGFHDDPGIMIFSMNSDPFGAMLLSSGSSIVHMNGSHTWSNYQPQPSTGAAAASHAHFVDDDVEPVMSKKSEANIPPPMTEEEQANYEKAVTSSIKKFSADNLLGSAVTCCITKTILRDPGTACRRWRLLANDALVSVVAADGFTYEREAILSWFKQSNRSPMTNQELSSQELNPNHAIKSILQSLADSSPLEKN